MNSVWIALQIHGNRILSDDQFVGFIFVPITMGIFGFLFLHLGLLLESVPVIGSIFWFVGALWSMLTVLFFAYLGWVWFISFIYLLMISIWCLDITDKNDAEKNGKSTFETDGINQIALGKSYRVKQVISFIAASLITVTNDGMISYVVLQLGFPVKMEIDVWTPWQGLI